MGDISAAEVYTAREISLAAGVAEADVLAALGGHAPRYLAHAEAVRLGRLLAGAVAPQRGVRTASPPLFSGSTDATPTTWRSLATVPMAVSGSAHALVVLAILLLTSAGLAPALSSPGMRSHRADPVRLVFLQIPGPGGGGGGGGLHQRPDPPRAMRVGRSTISSAVPRREPPKPIEAVARPPEPPRPIDAEPLPTVVAPIVAAPADARNRPGVLDQSPSQADSHGPGSDGGAGTGAGTGIGEGTGAGVGPGSGGGTGGGPYRPGSGIQPPRLLREVKADYTEDARRQRIEGSVDLEIVVRRDGTVGDVRVLKGLGGGLDDRAVEAVRQWRFAPATRLNAPVDVIVEVAVEFRLR